MAKRFLITGATGFIGSHLAESLVACGNEVRCLARRKSNAENLKRLKVEIVYGDLTDKQSLTDAVKNIDTIYHLAAQVRPHKAVLRLGELNRLYMDVNYRGTMDLALAALSAGVSRFIFFSTIAAHGPGVNFTEDSICAPITDYGESKLEAEKGLLELMKSKNLPVLIIRPGQIYGPRCLAMLPIFRLIKHGIFFSIGDGLNLVPVCHVADLVRGALLAAEKGKTGEAYFIFENCYTLRDYTQAIADFTKGRTHKFFIPKKIAYWLAEAKEAAERVSRLKICPFRMDLGKNGIVSFSTSWQGSADKARKELGFQALFDMKKGIESTVGWYQRAKLL
jgi:dihydroflavonol-4-reductase